MAVADLEVTETLVRKERSLFAGGLDPPAAQQSGGNQRGLHRIVLTLELFLPISSPLLISRRRTCC